jgi:hypothetical protein
MEIEYQDCIIVYKNGKGISLRATRLTVENADRLITIYDGDNLMAIVPFDEIKTVVFADCGSADAVEKLIEAISATIA